MWSPVPACACFFFFPIEGGGEGERLRRRGMGAGEDGAMRMRWTASELGCGARYSWMFTPHPRPTIWKHVQISLPHAVHSDVGMKKEKPVYGTSTRTPPRFQREPRLFASNLFSPLPPVPSPTDEVEDDGVDSFLPPFANAENKALDAEIRVRSPRRPSPPHDGFCISCLRPPSFPLFLCFCLTPCVNRQSFLLGANSAASCGTTGAT